MADEIKTCEDCTRFLLCKKIKDINDLPPLCEKFEDNFPEDTTEDVEEDDTDVLDDEKPPVMYICNSASSKCGECPHARPHNPFDEDEYLDGECINEFEECEEANQKVKCEPV